MLRLEKLAFLDWEAISLEVARGEIVCLRGSSGSGKSLLLRALADLIPHEGEASFEGKACSDFSPTEWRRTVGFLSAEALWWENVVGAHFLGEPKAEWLDRLGLDSDCLKWEVSRLSMGERQRLGLLRLLDREPRALLLDEPTANLDDKTSSAVESLISKYIADVGACAIWVTHDGAQAERIGGRLFEMEGKGVKEVIRG